MLNYSKDNLEIWLELNIAPIFDKSGRWTHSDFSRYLFESKSAPDFED